MTHPTFSIFSLGARRGYSLIVGVALVASLSGCTAPTSPESGPPGPGLPDLSAPSGGAIQSGKMTRIDVGGLPFAVGLPSSTGKGGTPRIAQAPQSQGAISPSGAWQLGGDFSRIASFPLDESTIFGSSTATPERLDSYSAAIVSQDGKTQELTKPAEQGDKNAVEPQDGSANDSWIVWRGATLNTSEESAQGIDNWSLFSYDRKSGTTRTLASAADLNQTEETRRASADSLPTVHGGMVHMEATVKDNHQWKTVILEGPADGSAKMRALTAAHFPASVKGGVLALQDPAVEGVSAPTVIRISPEGSGHKVEPQWSVLSEGNSWTITGLWAAGSHRVVAVSPTSGQGSGWLGLWEDGEPYPHTWLPTGTSRPLVNVGEEIFAWGSGSFTDDPRMWVADWSLSNIAYLGSAPGYSRPSVSPKGRTVMIPTLSETEAARWTVGRW